MIELKLIIMSFIIIISSYIGYIKANVYVDREKELKNILSALKYLRNKIEFTNIQIKNIFKEISENIYSNKPNIFNDVLTCNNDFSIKNCFIDSVNKNKKIDNEDKNILNNFALSLGKVERKIQISEIDIAYNFLLERLKDAEEKKIKNVKMYKTIGVAFGLVVSIILI